VVLALSGSSFLAVEPVPGDIAGLPQELVTLDLTASIALRKDIETVDALD